MHLKFFMKMQCVYLYLIYIRSISMHNRHRHLLIWDVCPGGKETWIELLMNLILDVPEFMSMTVQWCHFVDCSPRIPRQWGRDWHQPCHRGGHWENTGFLREPFTEGTVCGSTNTVVFAFHNLQTFSKVFFFQRKDSRERLI